MSDWDDKKDDETTYQSRRAALKPAGDAASVIAVDKKALSDVRSAGLAAAYVAAMVSCRGLGRFDNPSGRQGAYELICFPLGDATERGKASGACPGASSCGLFIRAFWQLFGIGKPINGNDRNLRAAYKDGSVIAYLALYAADAGALHGDFSGETGPNQPASARGSFPRKGEDITKWTKGDVVYIGDPTNTKQHIFTIVGPAEEKKNFPIKSMHIYDVPTVDGGAGAIQAGKDGGCQNIATGSKSFYRKGDRILVYQPEKGEEKNFSDVRWWIEFDILQRQASETDVFVPRTLVSLPGI
jgi:hypothetical protein